MPIVKVKQNYQITVPVEIRKQLNLQVGDYIEAMLTEDGILYKPKTNEDLDKEIIAYWKRREEEEGIEEVKGGALEKLKSALKELPIGSFSSVDEMMEEFNKDETSTVREGEAPAEL